MNLNLGSKSEKKRIKPDVVESLVLVFFNRGLLKSNPGYEKFEKDDASSKSEAIVFLLPFLPTR